MTKKQTEKFLNTCIDLFQLNTWIVKLEMVPSKYLDGICKVAECCYSVESMSASIQVSSLQTEDEIKLSIIHELLHLCMSEITALVDNASAGKSDDFKQLMNELVYQKAEECVIRLERAFAKIG